MASHRIDRTTEDIKRELTAILRELKDPRVQETMLSVVRVEVTNDLSYCKVYVSSMEGMDHAKRAVEGLKSAAGNWARESISVMCRRCSFRRRIRLNTAPILQNCSMI